jgi:DHA1 family multidrug resistance protein-like MFS transporter
MNPAVSMRAVHPRRLTALVSAIIFVDMITWLAVVPLIPTWQREYSLSDEQAGILLAAYGFAVLVFAIPTGYITDQIGPRRFTLIGLALFIIVVPALGLVAGFWEITTVRVLQGLCSAVIWSAGLSWLAVALEGPQRARSLVIANAAATTATVAGPVVGGPLTSALGLALTFGALGIVLVVLFVWALVEPGGPVRNPHRVERQSPFVALSGALRPGLLRASLIAIAFVALIQGALQLVGALRLDELGFTSSAIGWAFTAASAAALVALLTINRLGSRVRPPQVLRLLPVPIGLLCLGMALQVGAPLYVALLIGAFALSAPVFVMSFVACAEGAERQGVGEGAAFGALNGLWALGAVVSPVMAGFLLAVADEAAIYAVLLAVAIVAFVMLRRALRPVPVETLVGADG